MFRTPLRNSKSVNKPFKSPFDSPAQSKTENKLKNSAEKDNELTNSPLSRRTLEAKRVLVLDENERTPKKPKLSHEDEGKVSEDLANVTKNELLALKRKIFEMRQELDCLKSRERCSKKHDPKDLRNSIDRWKTACQSALEVIRSEFSEKNGQNSSIPDILKMLSIPPDIVHYSEKDDCFV